MRFCPTCDAELQLRQDGKPRACEGCNRAGRYWHKKPLRAVLRWKGIAKRSAARMENLFPGVDEDTKKLPAPRSLAAPTSKRFNGKHRERHREHRA